MLLQSTDNSETILKYLTDELKPTNEVIFLVSDGNIQIMIAQMVQKGVQQTLTEKGANTKRTNSQKNNSQKYAKASSMESVNMVLEAIKQEGVLPAILGSVIKLNLEPRNVQNNPAI